MKVVAAAEAATTDSLVAEAVDSSTNKNPEQWYSSKATLSSRNRSVLKPSTTATDAAWAPRPSIRRK
ncbi:unnamed protein product [Gongylonema pulchrum]|uniref:Uncharacterized protein n=1 Tax=Gongylonema pulchrum TaxID=637853 RepID=A0A183DNQ1_9BILA|nr:unnamed protein product [Gongylonema pulchrum]